MEVDKVNNVDLIRMGIESGKAFVDDGKETWNRLIEQILKRSGKIIALRGAGTINGADKTEADRLLQEELIPRIEVMIRDGLQVTIMYDGDKEDPERPDIGYFAGRLLAHFGNDPEGVVFVACQKRSWYHPDVPGGTIKNADGDAYVTYIFEDGEYEGDHNSFTQDKPLVVDEGYERWFIGASGKIADSQLRDYNRKVPVGEKRLAVLFRCRNNRKLDIVYDEQLKEAEREKDRPTVEKLQSKIEQRRNIYGTHWNNDGMPNIDSKIFPNLTFSFIKLF